MADQITEMRRVRQSLELQVQGLTNMMQEREVEVQEKVHGIACALGIDPNEFDRDDGDPTLEMLEAIQVAVNKLF